jgi:hypothetical protein
MPDGVIFPGGPRFAMTTPWLRTSPVHVPRRDLVLGLADSLWLRVIVVESDQPDALPIELTGGIGGPTLQMLVWPGQCYRATWDYGAPWIGPQSVLWAGTGVISDAPGAFDISFPTATMSSWPRRCAYALQLDWDGASGTSLLADGHIHLRHSVARTVTPLIMLTDPTPPVLTDDASDFILLDGVSQ